MACRDRSSEGWLMPCSHRLNHRTPTGHAGDPRRASVPGGNDRIWLGVAARMGSAIDHQAVASPRLTCYAPDRLASHSPQDFAKSIATPQVGQPSETSIRAFFHKVFPRPVPRSGACSAPPHLTSRECAARAPRLGTSDAADRLDTGPACVGCRLAARGVCAGAAAGERRLPIDAHGPLLAQRASEDQRASVSSLARRASEGP